jgi:hypothetical protein
MLCVVVVSAITLNVLKFKVNVLMLSFVVLSVVVPFNYWDLLSLLNVKYPGLSCKLLSESNPGLI